MPFPLVLSLSPESRDQVSKVQLSQVWTQCIGWEGTDALFGVTQLKTAEGNLQEEHASLAFFFQGTGYLMLASCKDSLP